MSKVHPPFAGIRIFTTSLKHVVWCFHEPRSSTTTNDGRLPLQPRGAGAPSTTFGLARGCPECDRVVAAATPAENAADPPSLPPDVITTVPASGDQLKQSPDSLVLTFNQEVDWFWGSGYVRLDRVNADQTITQLSDLSSTPDNPFDPTGTQATLLLDQPLASGEYHIVLVGGHSLATFVAGSVNDTLQDGSSWDGSTDLVLADFTVAPAVVPIVVPKGVTFHDATPLDLIGSQVTTLPGSLDPAAAQTYALYQVTLGPGHFWRLGVELDAPQTGSSLLGALTLFDSNGKVLATRDSGTGLPSSPDDPYFFTGLPTGVYYIGVSCAGNLPGQTGGYDPVTGTIGSTEQAGGAV